jgi:predicted transcriptional regulator
MALFAIRLDEDERRRLEQLARDRHITLSYAMREGARMYLNDWSAKREPQGSGRRAAT